MFENRHVLNVKESRIHDMIQEMYQLSNDAVENAIESLMSQDVGVAESVEKNDEQINHLYRQIEEECMLLIATQQPMARDLLEIIASLQISGEFERIGDHAKTIARIVKGMDASDFFRANGTDFRDVLSLQGHVHQGHGSLRQPGC